MLQRQPAPNELTKLKVAIDNLDPDKVKFEVQELLKKGISLNGFDEWGQQTPLTKLLIVTDIDKTNVDKYLTIITYLIKAGADPNVKSNSGYSPLRTMLKLGGATEWTAQKSLVMQALLKNGAQIRTDTENYFFNALEQAKKGDGDAFEFIKNIIYYESDKLTEPIISEYIQAISILNAGQEMSRRENQLWIVANLQELIDLITRSIQAHRARQILLDNTNQNIPREVIDEIAQYIIQPTLELTPKPTQQK